MFQAIAKKVEKAKEEEEDSDSPKKGEEFEPLVPFNYYMAPRSESNGAEPELVYSRVRLLEIRERRSGTWCFVHFIDYGFGQWVLEVSAFDPLLFVFSLFIAGMFGRNAVANVRNSVAMHTRFALRHLAASVEQFAGISEFFFLCIISSSCVYLGHSLVR